MTGRAISTLRPRSRGFAYGLVAAAAILPRLVVLLHERGTITAAYVDKGDVFARTLIAHGTYGFIPGRPSAYTQPLYGWFLVPLYWIFTRSWVVVGLAQIAVATATAILVYEIGRRWISPLAGLLAALAATLHPYLVWHDVHMNREILDELLAAAIVLLTLLVLDRRSPPLALALGAVLGLAILGNVRLVLLPLVVAAFLLATRRPAVVLVVLLACAVVVTPWVVRNRVSVGCTTLTTDGRALWKANNPNTLRTLEHGKWIDDVPPIPGTPPTPQDAGAIYAETGRIVPTNECAQMRYYRHLAVRWMEHHPGEKAKLAGQAVRMEWDPRTTASATDSGRGFVRTWAQPLYMSFVYALGLLGLLVVRRSFAVLALLVLAYQTLAAVVFVGATRYRVSTDFLIALLAAAALEWVLARRRAFR